MTTSVNDKFQCVACGSVWTGSQLGFRRTCGDAFCGANVQSVVQPTTDDLIGTLATLVSTIDDPDFDASQPDQVRDLVQYIDVQCRAAAEPKSADLAQIAGEWQEARDIIAQALREMGIDAERVEHNAAAIIARLGQACFILEKATE